MAEAAGRLSTTGHLLERSDRVRHERVCPDDACLAAGSAGRLARSRSAEANRRPPGGRYSALVSDMLPQVRALALYLPQYFPIPENDEWWGPGFTEWTNVAAARPLFRGHHQPNLPGELGFYDLRVPEVRIAQTQLAQSAGIEGFVYWHYWFAGRRLLDRPLRELLSSGVPDFPFCVAWANQSWAGMWHGEPHRVLIEQTYPGRQDYEKHFGFLLPALQDPRYVCVEDRPLVLVFRPTEIPDSWLFTDTWRALARDSGLPGLYLVGFDHDGSWNPLAAGFDGAVLIRLTKMFAHRGRNIVVRARRRAQHHAHFARLTNVWRRPIDIYRYAELSPKFVPNTLPEAYESYPCVIPNWDNTPRAGRRGSVLVGSTPEIFGDQVRRAAALLLDRPSERRLLFIKSWNEWAEGNYLEPDRRWGRGYLAAVRTAVLGDGGSALWQHSGTGHQAGISQ